MTCLLGALSYKGFIFFFFLNVNAVNAVSRNLSCNYSIKSVDLAKLSFPFNKNVASLWICPSTGMKLCVLHTMAAGWLERQPAP